MSIEAKLAELGIVLPEPAAPVAAYVPVVIAGSLAHVSGQVSFVDGVLLKGRLGEDVVLELRQRRHDGGHRTPGRCTGVYAFA